MTPKEYNHCVELYADRVYRFMLKNTREAAEAEDMVQNAFEVLWRNHEKVEVDKARSYLFSVSHHQMIDSLRKNKRMSKRNSTLGGIASGLRRLQLRRNCPNYRTNRSTSKSVYF